MVVGLYCAYCESLTPTRLVDHFRPTEEAASLDGKTVARDHYWWLAYEWENLLPTCPTCMSHKGKRFPIKGPRATPAPGRGLPTAEHALFLDPCRDQPEQSLAYEQDGRVVPLDERGATTIAGSALTGASLSPTEPGLPTKPGRSSDAQSRARLIRPSWAHSLKAGCPTQASGVHREGRYGRSCRRARAHSGRRARYS